jgi:isopentenyl-diphosphate delta-isomerase
MIAQDKSPLQHNHAAGGAAPGARGDLPGGWPVEVLDGQGRLLAVVPEEEAHRQSLPHRAALVLVYDRAGKLLFGKRPQSSAAWPGRFDLMARGHTRPGEAAGDAARRLALSRHPELRRAPSFQRRLGPREATGHEELWIFCVRLDREEDQRNGQALAVSREEMAALAAGYRELFTPFSIQAYEDGVLFGLPPDAAEAHEPRTGADVKNSARTPLAGMDKASRSRPLL